MAAVDQPSVSAAFQEAAAAHADRPALRAFGGGPALTWREYAAGVEAIARGLWARGVRPGSTVALLIGNRPEFNLVDAAALHLGATPFSLGHPAPAEQTEYLLADAGPGVVVTEASLLDTARAAIAAGEHSADHVLVVEDELDGPPFGFAATWRAVGAEDIATIVYTSGTTACPRASSSPTG